MTLVIEGKSLKIEREFSASPDAVFDAWTQPAALNAWFGPGEIKVQESTVNLAVGGDYRIHMKSPDGDDHIVTGTYIEISRPSRLKFNWQWETGTGDPSIVTVEFVKIDTGTKLILSHNQFSDESAAEHHSKGWTGCFDHLTQYIQSKGA